MIRSRTVSVLTNNLCCDQLTGYYTRVEKYFRTNGWRVKNSLSTDYITIVGCGPFSTMSNLVCDMLRTIRKKRKHTQNVILMGCIPSTLSTEMRSIHDGVIIKYGEEDKLDEITKANIRFWDIDTINVFKKPKQKKKHEKSNLFAILISEGCFMKCTYCIINRAYGRIRSKPLDEIENEFRKAIVNGYRNIELIGTDTSIYGADIGGNVVELMSSLLNIDPDVKFYLSNFNTNWLHVYHNELVAIANKIAYIHMPLQHVNEEVLNKMGRRGDFSFIYDMLKRLKDKNGDIYLNTDLICGFPGETEEQYNELLEFVRNDACFSNYTINYYFDNAETRASKMDGKISSALKILRRDELQNIANTKINITLFSNLSFERHKMLRQMDNNKCYFVNDSFEEIE